MSILSPLEDLNIECLDFTDWLELSIVVSGNLETLHLIKNPKLLFIDTVRYIHKPLNLLHLPHDTIIKLLNPTYSSVLANNVSILFLTTCVYCPDIKTKILVCNDFPNNTIVFDKAYVDAFEFKNAMKLLHNRMIDNSNVELYASNMNTALMAQLMGTLMPNKSINVTKSFTTGMKCISDISQAFKNCPKPVVDLPKMQNINLLDLVGYYTLSKWTEDILKVV